MAAKSIRKSVSFDQSDGDQMLWAAIAAHQSQHQQSFSDLCKHALKQYLLSQEPTQSVLLFMELQQQITQLRVRVAALEDEASIALAFNQTASEPPQSQLESPTEPQAASHSGDTESDEPDPVLDRLGPLLDDF